MTSQILSETKLLEAVSFERYMSQKRSQNETKYDFGMCRICQDDATGIHYGVSTCEGCKGFFKRSIDRFNRYRCRNGKKCVILPKQRKKCKFCRWMTCVRAGMSVSKIRMGRIPNSLKDNKPKNLIKDKKEKNLFHLDQIVPNTSFAKDYLFSLGEDKLVVLSLLRDKSYQLYRDLVDEFEPQEKRALLLVQTGYSLKFEQSSEFMIELKSKDLILLKKHARAMIQLMKNLPGFENICHHDIKTILFNAFFTTLGIRTIKLFIKNDYFLMLDEEMQLNRELFGVLLSESVRDSVFDFFFSLKSLHLTDHEYALLIPLILTLNSENIKEPKIFKELAEYYLRALFYELSLNNRNSGFVEKLAHMVSWAPKMNKLCQDIELFMKLYD